MQTTVHTALLQVNYCMNQIGQTPETSEQFQLPVKLNEHLGNSFDTSHFTWALINS